MENNQRALSLISAIVRIGENLLCMSSWASAAVGIACGILVGFYAFPGPSLAWIILVFAAAGFSITLLGYNADARWGLAVLSITVGLACGGLLEVRQGGVPNGAMAGANAGTQKSLQRETTFRYSGIEGRLVTDSIRTRKGARLYKIQATYVELTRPGMHAQLGFSKGSGGPIVTVLVTSGKELEAGNVIRIAVEQSNDPGLLFGRAETMKLVSRGNYIDQLRSAIRAKCRYALTQAGGQAAGMLEALMLGVKESLVHDEAALFKAAGCAHVLALSGEHLSVLALVALIVLRPLIGPFYAHCGAALLASFFMWIAGAGPSLLRAVIMFWLAALMRIIDRPAKGSTMLAVTFVVMILFDPEVGQNIGFILSFLAVWGLIVFSPRIDFFLQRYLPKPVASTAAAALAAQLAVAPVLCMTFGFIPWAGIPASIAASPLVAGIMWWSLGAAIIVTVVPASAPVIQWVSETMVGMLETIMQVAAGFGALKLDASLAKVVFLLAVGVLMLSVYTWSYVHPAALRRKRERTLGASTTDHGVTGSQRVAVS